MISERSPWYFFKWELEVTVIEKQTMHLGAQSHEVLGSQWELKELSISQDQAVSDGCIAQDFFYYYSHREDPQYLTRQQRDMAAAQWYWYQLFDYSAQESPKWTYTHYSNMYKGRSPKSLNLTMPENYIKYAFCTSTVSYLGEKRS